VTELRWTVQKGLDVHGNIAVQPLVPVTLGV
jgi:hypothetical protein